MQEQNWDDLRLFFHVATAGGLSGASAKTGISAPTIGRRMRELERATGSALFIRSPTGYELAPDGQILMEKVRAMRAAAQSIADLHQPVQALPIVRISGDLWMLHFIASHLSDLWSAEDPFRLCFKTGNATADLLHREADIGLHDERPQTGNIAARPLFPVAFAPYCASGHPIDGRNWVALGTEAAMSPAAKWTSQQAGLWITGWSNVPQILHELIRSGAGKGVLPCFVGDDDPALVRAGHVINEVQYEAWLLMHDDERHRPEVRTAIDRLVTFFARERERLSGNRPSEMKSA